MNTGSRPSVTFTARLRNKEPLAAVVQVRGFYLNGTAKTEYVCDSITVGPGGVMDINHYAEFDALEFRFTISSEDVEVSAWGKNAVGNMTVVYHLQPVDIIPPGVGAHSGGNTSNATSSPGNLSTNRIYVPNPGNNTVSVLDGGNQALLNIIPVGTNPKSVGINPATGRVYVVNQGSNNVTIIDDYSNTVIATVMVGAAPEEIRVDVSTNRISVTNHGSGTVSVISGSTHTVIATASR
jgi:YVTN family beta-propeller protein